MSQFKRSGIVLLFMAAGMLAAQSGTYGLGRPATPEEVRQADITVFPDGRGLPVGHGNATLGEAIFNSRCALCHNAKGEGRKGEYPALVGGKGSLGTKKPVKTVGSYWPYATTLFDHINRAMPFNSPHILPPNDVYSAAAYILFLNGIVGKTDEMNERTLPQVKMPNRDGFVPDSRPDIEAKR